MSEELASQADEMQETISFFNLGAEAKTRAKAPVAAAAAARKTAPVAVASHEARVARVESRAPKGIDIALDDDSSPAVKADAADSEFKEY